MSLGQGCDSEVGVTAVRDETSPVGLAFQQGAGSGADSGLLARVRGSDSGGGDCRRRGIIITRICTGVTASDAVSAAATSDPFFAAAASESVLAETWGFAFGLTGKDLVAGSESK